MHFLAPFLLLGALAAAVPIALHFFYRSRYRTVPWAAMKFLLLSIEQTSRRLRFQELLLLVLRVTALVLLAVALARFTTNAARSSGESEAVDAVFVLDTSLSMSARDGAAPAGDEAAKDPYLKELRRFARGGTVTRLARAKASALAVLAHLPPNSTVQVYAASDRVTLLGPENPAHLNQARKLIEDVEETHRGTDLAAGVRTAALPWQPGDDRPRREAPANKEFYLFSDMKRAAWDAQRDALRNQLQDLRGRATVHLVHCATRAPANVGVAGVTPLGGLVAGQNADFAVTVRNTGTQAVPNVTVALGVDGQQERLATKTLAQLGPGEAQTVFLKAALARPGRRALAATARGDGDDLDADNRFDQVVQVRDRFGILIVDGDLSERDPHRGASYYLQRALLPSLAEVVAAEEASPKDLANKELCVLVNVGLPLGGDKGGDFLKALAGFVRAGNRLLIFPGDQVEKDRYNSVLLAQHQLLPREIAGVEPPVGQPPGPPVTLDRQSAESYPFSKFRQEELYASMNKVEVRRRLVLGEAPAEAGEGRVLLRYGNGQPAVVSRKVGEGEVWLFTTSVHDPAWTDWFVAPSFVPLVQVSLGYLLQGLPPEHNRKAGEPLEWRPKDGAAGDYQLVLPSGAEEPLGPPAAAKKDGPVVVKTGETSRAGVYRIRRAGAAEGEPFAVVTDPAEGKDLEPVDEKRLDELLGFAPVHLKAGGRANAFSGADRLEQEWTLWLLGGLMALVLGEALLAWSCGRAW